MARNFDGTADYLEAAAGVIASLPVTIAAWIATDSLTTAQAAVSVGTNGANGRVVLGFDGSTTGDPVFAQSVTSGGTAISALSGSSGASAGAWLHAVARFDSTSARYAGVNGVYGSASLTTNDPSASGWNRTVIGARRSSTGIGVYFDGLIAEVGVWNMGLATADIEQLAAGYSPLSVRPESLIAYIPCFGRAGAAGDEEDWSNGLSFVQTSSPALADHPRIIYPRRRSIITMASAAASLPTLSSSTYKPGTLTADGWQPRVTAS